jgi:hypothetical protein
VRESQQQARWLSEDGSTHELLRLGWESGGWTAEGVIDGAEIHYVLRLDQFWKVRQFLLFRDMEEPDLWLATDGHGRWGEMNGAHRPDLDGCIDLVLPITPFSHTVPIRRLQLEVGHGAEVIVARVDHDTLEVRPVRIRLAHLEPGRWEVDGEDGTWELEVDEDALVTHQPGRFRRVD